MSKVEGAAGAVLGLVRLHDALLELEAAVDDLVDVRIHVPRLEQFKQLGVGQQAGLDGLGQTVDVVAAGKGGQGVGVHHHHPGLPEGAHHVLGVPQVHGGLAADGGIDHGQGGGGAVDEIDAPHIDGRRKAGQVSHHAAAHGHHQIAPAHAERQHLLQHRLQRAEALAALALGHRNDHGLAALVGHLAGIHRGHPAVGDHRHPAVQIGQLVQVLKGAPPQGDVVTAGAQVHGQLAAKCGFTHFVYTPNIRTVRQVRSSSRSRASLSALAGSPTSSA